MDEGQKPGRRRNGKALVPAVSQGKRPVRRVVQHSDYTRPVPFITESEVYALADAVRAGRHGERDYLVVMTMFQGDLRISEAVGLRVTDKRTVDGKHLLGVIGKGGKPRLVAIPERLSHAPGNFAHEEGLAPDDLPGLLRPVARNPPEYDIGEYPGYRYVPYWRIDTEFFTCFPVVQP